MGPAAVDRGQRRHSLHPRRPGPQTQEVSQVGSEDVRLNRPGKQPVLSFCWFCSRWSGAGDLLKLARQFDFMFHQEDEDVLPPAAAAEEAALPLDDDLDLLFAGATQQVGGALSPAPSGADSSALRSPAAADVEGTLAGHALQDDWGDDDLLNDSLLLEVTQNPHRFSSPEFCSTQKGPGCQSPAGIRLVSSPASSDGSVQMSSDARQNQVLSGRAVGSEWTRPVTLERQEPGSSSAEPDQNLSPGSWRPAGDDLLPLLPDPVWDDPADDQLLCELCEDLENQLQKQRPTSTQQRAALQPANRNLPPPSSTSTARGWVRTGSQPAPKTSPHHGQFTFKKPVKPVSFKGKGGGVGAGLGWGAPPSASAAAPCSAAEIEQKKQRAIQRRRRRLQLAQGLGPPPEGPDPHLRARIPT